ncbi:SDR family NAD(P)-dependent oxidoreductase [Streptomyces sp. NPDC059679]|uniref:SDR family NAD(P)-dependent oxidoreductase n=1 Tax=Streptomyces sp. NPDC059679 TaxID=3346903 RepID=UPI00368AA9BD
MGITAPGRPLHQAAGGSARYVVADMTDEAEIQRAVQVAAAATGCLDIAVNNAGYDGECQLTQDYPTDMLDHMIAINVRGMFLSMKYELRPSFITGTAPTVGGGYRVP